MASLVEKGHKTNSDPNPAKRIENKDASDKRSEKNATIENADPKNSKACSGQQRAC